MVLTFSGIGIGGLHFLVHRVLPQEAQTPHVFYGDLFIYFLTAVTLMIVAFLLEKMPKKVGFAFLGMSMVKMIVTTIFLLPEILNKTESTISYVLQFFAVYFSFLVVEAILTFRELNKMP